MKSEHVSIDGTRFEVWGQSFRVIMPFFGPVIHVGNVDLRKAMEAVSKTANAARGYQHKRDVEKLKEVYHGQ